MRQAFVAHVHQSRHVLEEVDPVTNCGGWDGTSPHQCLEKPAALSYVLHNQPAQQSDMGEQLVRLRATDFRWWAIEDRTDNPESRSVIYSRVRVRTCGRAEMSPFYSRYLVRQAQTYTSWPF